MDPLCLRREGLHRLNAPIDSPISPVWPTPSGQVCALPMRSSAPQAGCTVDIVFNRLPLSTIRSARRFVSLAGLVNMMFITLLPRAFNQQRKPVLILLLCANTFMKFV